MSMAKSEMTRKDHAAFAEFLRLNQALDKVYSKAAARMELSESSFDVLYSFAELGDGCSQKDICEACYLPKQTVHSAVDKLVKEGFLVKERGQGRGVALHVSAEGRSLIETRIYPIMDAERRALESLGIEERQHYLQLSRHLLEALQDQLAQVPAPEGARS